jgi:hypothetical protein
MAEPIEIVVPMLCEMRDEFAALHAETMAHFEEMERRLDALEREQHLLETGLIARRALREQLAARLRGRIGSLERKVQRLEAQK